jgi:hypothetical protein
LREISAASTELFMVCQNGKGRLGTTLAAAIAAVAMATGASAQILPPAPELAAKVLKLTGQVSVLKDSEPWALNIGDSVQVMQVIVTGPDGYAQFEVSDGSTFEVYPNSNVVFRKNPTNWRDLLDVFVGRVKVHIQKWGGQPNPNRIHTPSAVISVRGTTFDVTVDPEDDTTTVSVEEGQVDVRHALKGGETKVLNPGESIQVYKTQPLASRMIDKGAIAQRVLQALNDALYTMSTTSRLPGRLPGGSDGGGGSGQTQPLPAPPPPPPPAPPPPH